MIQKIGMSLNHANAFLVVIPILFGLLRFGYMTTKMKVFFIFVVSTALLTWISYFARYFGNNLYLWHLFTVIQLIILGSFFYKFEAKILFNKAILFSVLVILALAIYEAFFSPTKLTYYNSYTGTAFSLFIAVLSIGELIKLRRNELIDNLADSPIFWLCLGIALYYSSTTVIVAFQKSIQDISMELLKKMSIIQLSISLISIAMYSIGFKKIKRSTHEPSKT